MSSTAIKPQYAGHLGDVIALLASECRIILPRDTNANTFVDNLHGAVLALVGQQRRQSREDEEEEYDDFRLDDDVKDPPTS